MRPLVVGTRGSALAGRQTALVIRALRAAVPGIEVEASIVRTEGDRRQDVSLEDLGGQGVFVSDIEHHLQSRDIDLAVHSLKDIPATLPADLAIAAVLRRGDVRDVLAGSTLEALPLGARVGTDSRRRSVQLLALRPDLKLESIRGNVDTRIAKAESGEYNAVVLAMAGLDRLGLHAKAAHTFSIDEMVPAVGQAVLAVECRADDAELIEALALIEDSDTRIAITAERAFLARLGAGCRLPVGAYGELDDAGLRLRGFLADEAGAQYKTDIVGDTDDASWLGMKLAEWLAEQAGQTLAPMVRR